MTEVAKLSGSGWIRQTRAVARGLNTVVYAVTSTQMRSRIYLVDVLARALAEQRMTPSTIQMLQVPLPNGTSKLSQIAPIDYGREFLILWRRVLGRIP